MRNQKPEVRSQKFKMRVTVFLFLTFHFFLSTAALASEKWPGVDESVVEKYAKEHGREASEPFINTDRGDLLLFVFLLAGAVGGFAAGYSWRMLTESRSLKTDDSLNKMAEKNE
jgi:cobalt/nickel transport protein